jgi:hypothetical protein
MDHVLKKLGLVAIATIGLSLAATPAFAAPASHHHPSSHAPKGDCGPTCPTPDPTFGDAFWTFIDGGADLGRGAAEIVAGAYTGIATTPALIAHSFAPCGGGC